MAVPSENDEYVKVFRVTDTKLECFFSTGKYVSINRTSEASTVVKDDIILISEQKSGGYLMRKKCIDPGENIKDLFYYESDSSYDEECDWKRVLYGIV